MLMFAISMSNLYSQYAEISGVIKDGDNQPLPYSTIIFTKLEDSSTFGEITNENGVFSLKNLSLGDYSYQVSYVGFENCTKRIKITGSVTLPDIILKDGIALGEVTVTGHRKLIKSDKGKLTLQVADSRLSTLPSANDILSFVPSVKVLGESVEIIGKGTPLIFINGKEIKNTSQIQSLQPEKIKTITVDRNPSSKYDARYKSVIHIITKDAEKQELAVQFIHGSMVNHYYNHTEEININHSVGKLNNFFSYKYKDISDKEKVNVFQNILTEDLKQENKFNSNTRNDKSGHNITFSSNMKINEKNRFDIQYFFDKTNLDSDITGMEQLTGQSTTTYDVLRDGNTDEQKHTVNFYYNLYIDSINAISVFADYSHLSNKGRESITNQNRKYQSFDNYNLRNNSKFDTYALRAEYSTTLFDSYDFNAGVRFSNIKSNVQSRIDKIDQDENVDNRSKLEEKTISAYMALSKDFGAFSAEAGLRGEYNQSRYLKDGVSVFGKKRKLKDLFPSFAINYPVSENLEFDLSYTSKIQRPSFKDLDPSIEYLSTILYQQGNPTLKPTKIHTIELSALIAGSLNLSVAYVHQKNIAAYLIEQNPSDSLLYNRVVNLNKASSLDFNASYSLQVGNLQTNLIGYISVPFTKYPYMGETKRNNKTQYQFATTNMYMLSPKTFLFGNFMAQSRYSYLNNEFSPTYSLTLGANFILFNGKAVLTIFANDILRKTEPETFSEWGYINTGQKVVPDSRQIGFKLKINFNKFSNKFKASNSNQEDLLRLQKY